MKEKLLEKPLDIENEKLKFYYRILEKTEPQFIDAIHMRSIDNRDAKIQRIWHWYIDKLECFNQLKHIEERTEKEWFQIEEKEPIKEPPMTKDEMNEHRVELFGYENAAKRLSGFKRKEILSKEKKEKPKNLKDDGINFYGKLFGYNTMTSFQFKPNNDYHTKNNISEQSTKYGTFYKINKAKSEINTGSDFFSRTGMDWGKECKNSYSYYRSPYDIDMLQLEKVTINDKNKEISVKRNLTEISDNVDDFGFRRSFYKGFINKKHETKDLLIKYKDLIKKKQIEMEKKLKIEKEEKLKQKELRQKELLEKRSKAIEKMREVKKKKIIKESIICDNNQNMEHQSSGSQEKPEEEKENQNLLDLRKDSKIEANETNSNIENEDSRIISNYKIDINQFKKLISEIDDKTSLKSTQIKKNKIYDIKDDYLDKKNKEMKEKNLDLEINADKSKKLKQINIEPSIAAKLLFTNRLYSIRNFNRKLNDFKIFDLKKTSYLESLTPLSLYDLKYESFRKNKKNQIINYNSNNINNFGMKTFYNNKGNFLEMRKSISAHKSREFKNSLLYKKSKIKTKHIFDKILFYKNDNIKYSMYFYPKTEANLMQRTATTEKKKHTHN